MLPELIDSHCHLDVEVFNDDRGAVIARARAAGVSQIIVPAIARSGWDNLHSICAADAMLHPAFGLHPMYLDRHVDDDLHALESQLAKGDAVAVGECGLDHFVEALATPAQRERQRRLFEAQLQLACEHELPVIIHARRAVEDVISCLRRAGKLRGVIHSFPGSVEQAEALWRLGFLVGFGGPITYQRANRLRAVVAAIPAEQLLLESDAPDQPDAGWRGQRNEPCRIVSVLKTAALLRQLPAEEVAHQTSLNAAQLFGLPD